MVAAWIKALTGVGPSIASGSHTCSGNWADLPMAPRNMRRVDAVNVPVESRLGAPATSFSASAKIADNSKVPVALNRRRMPMRRPTSPIRVVTNAFLAASAAERFSYQKPMRR